MLATLNHPNIVKYFETFVEEKTGKLQIVMEYCEVWMLPLHFQLLRSSPKFVCLTLHVPVAA